MRRGGGVLALYGEQPADGGQPDAVGLKPIARGQHNRLDVEGGVTTAFRRSTLVVRDVEKLVVRVGKS